VKKRRRGEEEEEEVGARIEDFEFFLLQFSWVFNLEVWGSFILDHSFFQGAQSKGFQGLSNTPKSYFEF